MVVLLSLALLLPFMDHKAQTICRIQRAQSLLRWYTCSLAQTKVLLHTKTTALNSTRVLHLIGIHHPLKHIIKMRVTDNIETLEIPLLFLLRIGIRTCEDPGLHRQLEANILRKPDASHSLSIFQSVWNGPIPTWMSPSRQLATTSCPMV